MFDSKTSKSDLDMENGGTTDRALGSHAVMLGGISAKYEMWSWDGIYGESIIFQSSDVTGISDEDILKMIRAKWPHLSDTGINVVRKEELVFVNWAIFD